MRLIDADALMEHVYRDRLDSRELIAEMVRNAPTIEDRKTGRWISNDRSGGYFCSTCSKCGYIVIENAESNYCPNCGAYMNGESDG